MRRALQLARRGWGQTAPNPLVGAVVVRDGRVVGEGWHARYGEAHAEVAALQAAGELARGATLYVTLEPCAHHGKTPPCSDAVLRAGIARVVIAVADPSPQAGGGARRLVEQGVRVDVGVERDAACELDAPFFFRFTPGGGERPWVVLKLALSLDGAIADHTRRPGWLTNARSRRAVHRLRAGVDAVAVGIGTALADDPLLTVRAGVPPRRPPLRVVFDASARLPLDAALVRSAGETPSAVVTRDRAAPAAGALAAAGVSVLEAQDLRQGLRALKASGVESVLVEGGGAMAGALLRDDLVDRLIIFQAPVILGEGALPAFATAPAATSAAARRLRVVARRHFGDDLMTEYALHPLPCSPD